MYLLSTLLNIPAVNHKEPRIYLSQNWIGYQHPTPTTMKFTTDFVAMNKHCHFVAKTGKPRSKIILINNSSKHTVSPTLDQGQWGSPPPFPPTHHNFEPKNLKGWEVEGNITNIAKGQIEDLNKEKLTLLNNCIKFVVVKHLTSEILFKWVMGRHYLQNVILINNCIYFIGFQIK